MKKPKVGLAAIVLKEQKVLLGKRKASHGKGSWGFPGGHLKRGESFEEAVVREVGEETGLRIVMMDRTPVAVTNDIFEEEDKHYVTLYFRARYVSGEPEVREKDRCEEWRWFYWSSLPEPLFWPIQNLLKQRYKPL